MNYADTGKQSKFLERCVTNGYKLPPIASSYGMNYDYAH